MFNCFKAIRKSIISLHDKISEKILNKVNCRRLYVKESSFFCINLSNSYCFKKKEKLKKEVDYLLISMCQFSL